MATNGHPTHSRVAVDFQSNLFANFRLILTKTQIIYSFGGPIIRSVLTHFRLLIMFFYAGLLHTLRSVKGFSEALSAEEAPLLPWPQQAPASQLGISSAM